MNLAWEIEWRRTSDLWIHFCFTAIFYRFFSQTKYPSFQRQLNLYGFSRFSHGPDKGAYYHHCFIKGHEQLVRSMQRTKIKGTKVRRTPTEEPNFYDPSWKGHFGATIPEYLKKNGFNSVEASMAAKKPVSPAASKKKMVSAEAGVPAMPLWTFCPLLIVNLILLFLWATKNLLRSHWIRWILILPWTVTFSCLKETPFIMGWTFPLRSWKLSCLIMTTLPPLWRCNKSHDYGRLGHLEAFPCAFYICVKSHDYDRLGRLDKFLALIYVSPTTLSLGPLGFNTPCACV